MKGHVATFIIPRADVIPSISTKEGADFIDVPPFGSAVDGQHGMGEKSSARVKCASQVRQTGPETNFDVADLFFLSGLYIIAFTGAD